MQTTEEIRKLQSENPDRKGDTLDDLEASDFDNWEHLLKKCHQVPFRNQSDALRWVRFALFDALRKLGFSIDEFFARQIKTTDKAKQNAIINSQFVDKRLETELKQKGIRVETRSHESQSDKFKDGTYVIKNGEIVFYFSDMIRPRLIAPFREWVIYSNFRFTDVSQGRFEIVDDYM